MNKPTLIIYVSSSIVPCSVNRLTTDYFKDILDFSGEEEEIDQELSLPIIDNIINDCLKKDSPLHIVLDNDCGIRWLNNNHTNFCRDDINTMYVIGDLDTQEGIDACVSFVREDIINNDLTESNMRISTDMTDFENYHDLLKSINKSPVYVVRMKRLKFGDGDNAESIFKYLNSQVSEVDKDEMLTSDALFESLKFMKYH